MKALKFIFITAILSFAAMSYEKNVTPLVDNDKVIPTAPNTSLCPECPFLIPLIPLEASFGDMIELESSADLIPVVPMEADFDDGMNLPIKQDSSFTPVVPSTADFNDIF